MTKPVQIPVIALTRASFAVPCHLPQSLKAFDAGVADCSASSESMLSQRRNRLQKALLSDLQELFAKQHRAFSPTFDDFLCSCIPRLP